MENVQCLLIRYAVGHININIYYALILPASVLFLFPFIPSQYALFYSFISDGDCTPITMSVKVVYSQTSNWLLVG
jgi:hypothetical protein